MSLDTQMASSGGETNAATRVAEEFSDEESTCDSKVADQIITDQKLAESLEKESFPTFIYNFVNNTRAPIYVYEDYEQNGWKYIGVIDSLEKEERTWSEWTYVNIILSNHEAECNLNDNVKLSDINPEHIIQFISMGVLTKVGNDETYRETIVITDKDSSSQLDQWKEAALKSQFLLKELSRLGAGNNENYEPIMDMVQDIGFPEHSEQDKERAGVTSEFTNVSLITGNDDDYATTLSPPEEIQADFRDRQRDTHRQLPRALLYEHPVAHAAATRIQAIVRGRAVRLRMREIIQAIVRGSRKPV
jgi:hypothetical protein